MFKGIVVEVENNGEKFYFCRRMEDDSLPNWEYILKTNSSLPTIICKPGNPTNHSLKVAAASIFWFFLSTLISLAISMVILPLTPIMFLALLVFLVVLVVISVKKVRNFNESCIDVSREDISWSLILDALSTQSTFVWYAAQHYLSDDVQTHLLGEDSLKRIIQSHEEIMGVGRNAERNDAKELNEVVKSLHSDL